MHVYDMVTLTKVLAEILLRERQPHLTTTLEVPYS